MQGRNLTLGQERTCQTATAQCLPTTGPDENLAEAMRALTIVQVRRDIGSDLRRQFEERHAQLPRENRHQHVTRRCKIKTQALRNECTRANEPAPVEASSCNLDAAECKPPRPLRRPLFAEAAPAAAAISTSPSSFSSPIASSLTFGSLLPVLLLLSLLPARSPLPRLGVLRVCLADDERVCFSSSRLACLVFGFGLANVGSDAASAESRLLLSESALLPLPLPLLLLLLELSPLLPLLPS